MQQGIFGIFGFRSESIRWKIDPGAIGFTRGFSHDGKYYGG